MKTVNIFIKTVIYPFEAWDLSIRTWWVFMFYGMRLSDLDQKQFCSISRNHVSLQIYVANSSLRQIHLISAISPEIMLKSTSFSLKITKNGKHYHWRISCFTQMVKHKITFTHELSLILSIIPSHQILTDKSDAFSNSLWLLSCTKHFRLTSLFGLILWVSSLTM